MADGVIRRRTSMWALFAGLSLVWLFLRMLPLSTQPTAVPAPDLVLCLVLAWVLRRPDYMPALLVAAVVLLEDLLIMRPPGLWAALVVIGCEFLRGRQSLMRELSFPAEWAIVAAVATTLMLIERTVLAVTLVPQPALGQVLLQLVVTLAAYPLVVLATHYLLRIRKPATGEVDALGRPL